ncbi:ribokinase [uncultured Pelagimonas sp.]|uniref:ribokinase n=1 Tax=uncultured Pelagimonas sp. TaxID=1618102 RepID=UPI00261D4CE4|nr:ribokinase [uncultured Pelagimonas sp.]
MTIYNLGSINIDLVYRVPHLPGAGETLASTGFTKGLGGKGANMSVAVTRAQSQCVHIGAVGGDGHWAKDRLNDYGVIDDNIHVSQEATGHAIIAVDNAGENAIILYPGANHALLETDIALAMSSAKSGDTFLFQNETNGLEHGVKLARELGLRIAHAAAPFEAEAVIPVLPFLDLLVLNEVEAEQLQSATGQALAELPVADVVVTLGAKGCRWHSGQNTRAFPAISVTPIDTTGAGDTFTGYLIAALDQGKPMEQAIELAGRAGALMVTRLGTADVIPTLQEVQEAF